MSRPVLTTLIILALVAAFAVVTNRAADLRGARIEAMYPAEGQFVDVDGRNIHVVVRGQGPDLVVIHGAGGNYRDLASALGSDLTDRYRVFFVDRPGHGWSDRLGPAYEGTFNALGESPAEQARVLSEAVSRLGARDPIVLGYSYGGAVAMAWALEHPASALVILSGVTLPWPGEIDITYRLLGHPLGGAFLAPVVAAYVPESYVRSVFANAFDDNDPSAGRFAQAGIPLATRLVTLRANNQQVRTLKPHVIAQSQLYGRIELPIELVHGDADESVFLSVHSEPLSQRMPNARLTVLQDMGHMPHHLVPGAVIAAVDRAAARAGLR